MKSAASLSKYAPWDDSYNGKKKFDSYRVIKNSEGLQYIATLMSSGSPIHETQKIKVRCNLGATDAQTPYTNHIKAFFKAMKSYKHVTHLDLRHCQITDYTCKNYLEPMLQANSKITFLDVSDNIFTKQGAIGIFNSLCSEASKVETLYIARNSITYECMEAFASLVRQDKLIDIDFSATEIGAEGMKYLAPALEGANKLTTLTFENCKIGDEGCLDLAAVIAAGKLKNVKTINICENHIGRIGIEKLFANFVPGGNETVTSLDVSKNYFGDEGFEVVTWYMRKNFTMKTLKMSKVGITKPYFDTFCDHLQVRYDQEFGPYPDLEVLEIGFNGLGNEMQKLFLLLQSRNCKITAVNYEGNEVTNYGAKLFKIWLCEKFDGDRIAAGEKYLANAKLPPKEMELQRNAQKDRKNFKKMSFRNSNITTDGAENLAAIVMGNKQFQELDLRKNKIGVKGAIFFKKEFRRLQFSSENRHFKFHILTEDIEVEGHNHLTISARESPAKLAEWIRTGIKDDRYTHAYERHPDLQSLYNKAAGNNNSTPAEFAGEEKQIDSKSDEPRDEAQQRMLKKLKETVAIAAHAIGGDVVMKPAEKESKELKVDGEKESKALKVYGEKESKELKVYVEKESKELKVDGEKKSKELKVDGEKKSKELKVGGEKESKELKVDGEKESKELKVGGEKGSKELKVDGEKESKELKVGGEKESKELKIDGEKESKEPKVNVKKIEKHDDFFAPLIRPTPVDVEHYYCHLGFFPSTFAQFDTYKRGVEKSGDLMYGVELIGENDEKEDDFEYSKKTTYHSYGIQQTGRFIEGDRERGFLRWNPSLYGLVKSGFGSYVGNTLYRHGMMIRLKYTCESTEYVQDLYFKRYGRHKDNTPFLKKMILLEREDLIARLVSDDLKEFWENLMHQTLPESEGLTMFEFVLKYSKAPAIDCVRQFLNIFPAEAYARLGSKHPAVFLQQVIAQSGETFRDLCLRSTDRFVKRYAEAKNLVHFRFLETEPLYVSKFVKVSKVEDLLLSEEYMDEDRFFLMRKIASSTSQSDENLAKNEFNAHLSFQNDKGEYFSGEKSVQTYDNIKNLILPNVNKALEAEFIAQISMLHHRKQSLANDQLAPSFTKIYKANLREVLDNESLAGGRDIVRAQILLKMIANSLDHFNNRAWVSAFSNPSSEATKNRIHGNVKPRNIVLHIDDEMPDLYKDIGYQPGKWVLCGFERSTEHAKDYIPMKNSAYNPPEVAKRIMASGERHLKVKIPADEKMDVWQFGCVLFEVLSGTTLFKMEGNNDLIVDDRERGELANWVSLDEARSALILNQLKANKGNDGYKASYISMSLNNFGAYDEEEIESIIDAGKQLVQRCLQGRPGDRPTFKEILEHPFLKYVDVGKLSAEKTAESIIPAPDTTWSTQSWKDIQPHVHLVNSDFEQAGVVVKAMEQILSQSGCRLTTDSKRQSSLQEYEADIKKNCTAARIVAVLLTRDAFYKPNVIKQLLWAEDVRKKKEKPDGRILFIDLQKNVDLAKDGLVWDKEAFATGWIKSDEYQYMIQALARDNPSTDFDVHQNDYGDAFTAWSNFCTATVRAIILSYLQDPIKYDNHTYLLQPMIDRMLVDAHLVPTLKIDSFTGAGLEDKNFGDTSDRLNKKIKSRKEKFMNLYFLPAHKIRTGQARVYVLSSSGSDESKNAVSQIARALEAQSSANMVGESERFKNDDDPRNRIVSKVKTSYNIKKESHLKVSARTTFIRQVKDQVLNVERKEGALLIVLYCTDGVFKKYSKFLAAAVEERYDDLAIVLVQGVGYKPNTEEIEKNVPEKLKAYCLNKDNYIPFFKPKKDVWQNEALLDRMLTEAKYRMDHPIPKESFKDIDMTA